MPDHVHMMISIPPKYSVAQVVGHIVADISDSEVVVAILAHLGLPTEAPPRAGAESRLRLYVNGNGLIEQRPKARATSLWRRCVATTTRARCGGSSG